jgi:hypothetical protein
MAQNTGHRKRRNNKFKTRKYKKGGGILKPRIILQTRWGLGNQIIQYLIACAVQKRFGYEMFILPPLENVHSNNRDYRDLFIRGKKIDKIPDNFTDPYIVKYNDNMLRMNEIPENKNIFLELIAHCYETFKNIMSEVVNEMSNTLNTLYPDLEIKKDIKNGFIHIRRGDFVDAGWSQSFNYYNTAIKMVNNNKSSKVKHWYMFSDDIEWCKSQEWDKTYPIIFIDEKDELKGLGLMSQCLGGAIIGESTFAWSGAMIGANKKGIVIGYMGLIRHSKGYKYIGPSDWIYLDNDGKLYEYK